MKRFFLLLIPILLLSCSDDSDTGNNLLYRVTPRLKSDTTVSIQLDLTQQEGDSITLLLPPIYADNPILTTEPNDIQNLVVVNSNGDTLTPREHTVALHQFNMRAISFENDSSITVTYDQHFLFDTTAVTYSHMPTPTIDENGGYLQGSNLFAIPYHGEELVDLWRAPTPFTVTYDLTNCDNLMGDIPEWSGRNLYELLFSTSLLDGQILSYGRANNQLYRFIAPSNSFTAIDSATVAFDTILSHSIDLFGTLFPTHYMSVILDVSKGGGLEGMFAFTIYSDLWNIPTDGINTFNMVLAHEAVHFWIGVRVGDYDDPWWKEGTTNYYGYLISGATGTAEMSFVRRELLLDLSPYPTVQTMALSDPSLRYMHYEELETQTYTVLTYYKGAQVSMIMDAYIREQTNGRYSLASALQPLFKIYNGSAFTRTQYLNNILQITGVNVSSLFETYVDTPGVIDYEVLETAFETVHRYGGFGTQSLPAAPRVRSTTPLLPY